MDFFFNENKMKKIGLVSRWIDINQLCKRVYVKLRECTMNIK